jgi:hypothetical protein
MGWISRYIRPQGFVVAVAVAGGPVIRSDSFSHKERRREATAATDLEVTPRLRGHHHTAIRDQLRQRRSQDAPPRRGELATARATVP